jgi:hypothetical protein
MTPLTLSVWAAKKGPTTLRYSASWAVFDAKSAVAQRSGTNSALTLKVWHTVLRAATLKLVGCLAQRPTVAPIVRSHSLCPLFSYYLSFFQLIMPCFIVIFCPICLGPLWIVLRRLSSCHYLRLICLFEIQYQFWAYFPNQDHPNPSPIKKWESRISTLCVPNLSFKSLHLHIRIIQHWEQKIVHFVLQKDGV